MQGYKDIFFVGWLFCDLRCIGNIPTMQQQDISLFSILWCNVLYYITKIHNNQNQDKFFFFAIFIKKSCVHFLKIHKQGVHGRDAFCYVCINSVHWLWRSKLLFCQCYCIFTISFITLPEKDQGTGPLFEQIWISFIQGYFVPSFDEIGPVDLEKKTKMWKFYNNNGQISIRRDQLNFQSEKLLGAFSSGS